MGRNGWLHAAFATTMAVVVALTATTWTPWPSAWPAYVVILVLSLAYVVVGHRGYDDPRAAAVFLPLLVVAVFGAVAASPSTAFIQCIAFPLMWRQVDRIRTGVAVSILIGIAASAGFLIALGPSADTWAEIVIIEGISVAGACALGVWISRISQLSEDRRVLIDELHAAQESLALAERSAGVASERERIARDLHDTIAQNLAGIVMLAQRARSAPGVDLDERLSLIEDSAREALEESRTLVAAGAAGLAAGSLGGALHRLGERFGRETGVVVTVECQAGTDTIDRDTEVVLLRVAQEALANVRAHASATSVRIALVAPSPSTASVSSLSSVSSPPGGPGVRIEDDGRGFDVAAPASGFGLLGLHERLALAGGTFSVTSTPGGGTVVTATLAAAPPAAVPAVSTASAGPAALAGPAGSAASAAVRS